MTLRRLREALAALPESLDDAEVVAHDSRGEAVRVSGLHGPIDMVREADGTFRLAEPDQPGEVVTPAVLVACESDDE
jgi:hypothetical protein